MIVAFTTEVSGEPGAGQRPADRRDLRILDPADARARAPRRSPRKATDAAYWANGRRLVFMRARAAHRERRRGEQPAVPVTTSGPTDPSPPRAMGSSSMRTSGAWIQQHRHVRKRRLRPPHDRHLGQHPAWSPDDSLVASEGLTPEGSPEERSGLRRRGSSAAETT